MRICSRRLCATLLACVLVLLSACMDTAAAKKAFSQDEAYRYHYYLRASYCDANPVSLWTCGSACAKIPGFQTYTVLNNDNIGTRGFIGLDHQHAQIVVAFRGSDNMQNWLANILLVQVPYDIQSSCGGGCRVHTGFLVSYLSMREKTRAAVLALLSAYPTYEIVVTGHSLGGAMAMLAAVDLQELLYRSHISPAPQPVSLYTYGSPRVGNVAFAQWVEKLLSDGANYRITHARDPVVRLPFRSWDYAHTSGEVFYPTLLNSSRILCSDTVTKQDMRCSAGKFSVIMLDHDYYMGEKTVCECDAFNPKTDVPELTWGIYLQLLWDFTKGIFTN